MQSDKEQRRRQFREMSLRKKIQYILDYYLLLIIGILAAVVIVIVMAVDISGNKEPIFTVMVVSDTEPDERLVADMNEVLSPGEKETADIIYVPDDTEYSQMVIMTHFAAGEPDLFIAEREVFETAAESGMISNLSEDFSETELSVWQDQLLWCAEVERDQDGNEISRTEEVPCGVSLSADDLLERYGIQLTDPYIGIAAGSDIRDDDVKVLRMILEE